MESSLEDSAGAQEIFGKGNESKRKLSLLDKNKHHTEKGVKGT